IGARRRFSMLAVGQAQFLNSSAIQRRIKVLILRVAVLARTLNWSKTGRDVSGVGMSFEFTDRLFPKIMALELGLLKKVSLPFGVGTVRRCQKPGCRCLPVKI